MHISPMVLMFPPATPPPAQFPKRGGPSSRVGRVWGGLPGAKPYNKFHLECSEVREVGWGGGSHVSPTPGPRGCAQGCLLGTHQGHVLGTQDPGHACVLGTQNPAWPNGPTDSAPRGHWGVCRGQGASPYIYFVKNNNNKFV